MWHILSHHHVLVQYDSKISKHLKVIECVFCQLVTVTGNGQRMVREQNKQKNDDH